MKFIFKLLFLLVIGSAIFLTQTQTVEACCCVDNNPLTGQCSKCVPCGNLTGRTDYGWDGGGGVSCTSNYMQNCPAGTTRSNLVTSVQCYPNPQVGACGVGNAQAVGGCCEEGENKDGEVICKKGSVNTYLCCPPNSTATSTLVNGGTYTTAPSCGSAGCNDGDDLYIGSTGAGQSEENKCGWDCSFWDGEGDDQRCRSWNRIWRYKTITTCQERHLEYSCVPSCDANDWGAWSACSGTEETQTRTNACGTVETNNCSGSGWSSGGVAVSLDGGTGSVVSLTGTFTLLASSASSHTLAVSLPPGYICSTAAGCNSCSRTGIISPSNNNFFYLTNLREAWWQAEGAGSVRRELGGAIGALLRASGTD